MNDQIRSAGSDQLRALHEMGTDVAIQSDGKAIAAGIAISADDDSDFALARYNSDGSTGDFAIARYLPDGNPDPSFGSGGKVVTDFFGDHDEAEAVLAQADGQILVAGSAVDSMSRTRGAVARYNSDGSLDQSFGFAGKTTISDAIDDIALQTDGRIVAAASTTT